MLLCYCDTASAYRTYFPINSLGGSVVCKLVSLFMPYINFLTDLMQFVARFAVNLHLFT